MSSPTPSHSPSELPPSLLNGEVRLRLFVARGYRHSDSSECSVRQLCEELKGDGYVLEVIDVLVNPELAEQDRVLATPTLLRVHPWPQRRLVGDLSNPDRIRQMLEIELKKGAAVFGGQVGNRGVMEPPPRG